MIWIFECFPMCFGLFMIIFRKRVSAYIVRNQRRRFKNLGEAASRFNTPPFIVVYGAFLIAISAVFLFEHVARLGKM